MCYNVSSKLRSKKEYSKALNLPDPAEEANTPAWEPLYHASGFAHPYLPIIANESPSEISEMKWGLIPFWVKDEVSAAKISNQTLNARGETIFEKPSFRESAKNKRCLIIVDGFFEYQHRGSKTHPHFIKLKDDQPITLAGLWAEWTHNGQTLYTCSIVTTKANYLMATIHNNPKAEDGPRMPVILPEELRFHWLKPMNDKADKEMLQELIKPYPAEEMKAWEVGPLTGKAAIGNSPAAHQPVSPF